MNDNNTLRIKTIKITTLFLAIIILYIVGITIYNQVIFRMTSVNPTPGKVTVISPFFDVNFNKTLSKDISVTSQSDAISSYDINGKSININLNIPLNPKLNYQIVISNIKDINGKKLKQQTFIFTPTEIKGNDLPKDQGQALLNNQTKYNQQVEGNKLIQLLPFTGPNFEYTISYTLKQNGSSTPIIQITAPSTQAQQAAVAWISAQGFQPSSLDIQYITAAPQ